MFPVKFYMYKYMLLTETLGDEEIPAENVSLQEDYGSHWEFSLSEVAFHVQLGSIFSMHSSSFDK